MITQPSARRVTGEHVASLLVSHGGYTPEQAADEAYTAYRDGAAMVFHGNAVQFIPLGAWLAWYGPRALTSQEATAAIIAVSPSRLDPNSARKALSEARRNGSHTFYLPWLWRQPKAWLQVTYAGRNAYHVAMVGKPHSYRSGGRVFTDPS